jgi:hypothetical protein
MSIRPQTLSTSWQNTVKQSHYRPWQALRVLGGWSSHILRQWAHVDGKVVSPTHRPPLPQEIFLVLISVSGWVDSQSHSAAGRIMSMKNSNDTIGIRSRDLPVCSAVPQPLCQRVTEHSYWSNSCGFAGISLENNHHFTVASSSNEWVLLRHNLKSNLGGDTVKHYANQTRYQDSRNAPVG